MSRTYRNKRELYRDFYFCGVETFQAEIDAYFNDESRCFHSNVFSRTVRHAKDYDTYLRISTARLHSDSGRHLSSFRRQRAPSWLVNLMCERKFRRRHKSEIKHAEALNDLEGLVLSPFVKDACWLNW